MVSIDKIIEHIEKNFSMKRKLHTYGVRDTAIDLAMQYGCDMRKAEIAALLHDLYRGVPIDVLNYHVKHLELGEKYLNSPNLSHGKIAAEMIQRNYGVKDKEIIDAVSFHTTGRAGMSMLEKIIYIADAIEPNRDYPGVDHLRESAKKDIDVACLESINNTIDYVRASGTFLDPDTLTAKEYFEKIIEKRRKFMTNKDYALLAGKVLSDKKAEDIVIIDIQEKATFADYFVICSGTSERQINTLTDEVEDRFAQNELFVKSVEGKNGSGWILMDFGDIIVNLFTKEMRERYSIERVWGDCQFIEVEE